MENPAAKPNGRIRAWLSGAFYATALLSFAVNYCVFSGKLSMQSQGGAYQEADYISASEALKPVKLTRSH